MTQLGLLACPICRDPFATVKTAKLNGLPVNVAACDRCRQAVKDRQLGVTQREDGHLSIYGRDGQGQRHRGIA